MTSKSEMPPLPPENDYEEIANKLLDHELKMKEIKDDLKILKYTILSALNNDQQTNLDAKQNSRLTSVESRDEHLLRIYKNGIFLLKYLKFMFLVLEN